MSIGVAQPTSFSSTNSRILTQYKEKRSRARDTGTGVNTRRRNVVCKAYLNRIDADHVSLPASNNGEGSSFAHNAEPGDGVTSYTRRRHNSSSDGVTSFMTASARTDSNADLEDSSYDASTMKSQCAAPERASPFSYNIHNPDLGF
ncbi:hypothetical protein Tco_1371858 [Tanacetum coccineum]